MEMKSSTASAPTAPVSAPVICTRLPLEICHSILVEAYHIFALVVLLV